MSEEESYLAVLKATYDYQPQTGSDDELEIKEDQVLFLLERTDEDWWKVKVKTDSDLDGPFGLVPSAYVEPAPHSAVARALYDYEASQPGELTVKEDDVLYVYDKEDDWWLVSQGEDGKVGYVPGNYCGGAAEGSPAQPAIRLSISQIVIPDSPPRPAYVDPAERVASNKAQADDIKTWSISEVDKKGKKKKGTLGVGNGAIFFASEADKTPVQKWQTSDLLSFKIEKSKHVHVDIGGPQSANLHFHTGSKDVADEIVAKLESSRALSQTAPSMPPALAPAQEPIERPRSSAKSVHFDAAEPVIIPPPVQADDYGDDIDSEPSHSHDGDLADHTDGESAVALYDFTADGEDELSVREGETLQVLERDSDEWWKVRNLDGLEGVVPASYVELLPSNSEALDESSEHRTDHIAAAAAREAKEAAALAEAEHAEAEKAVAAEKERKKREAEQRAEVAAAAAEADRRRREQEREKQKEKEKERAAAVEKEESSKKQQEDTPKSARKSNGDAPKSRSSVDNRGPPNGNIRTWHDRSGQFNVDAAFLGLTNGKLRLHKVNGVVIEVPTEKMSAEDMRYVEKAMNKSSSSAKSDDDDEPLEHRRRSLQPGPSSSANRASPPKKAPSIDWFEFFLNAGCDVDDCTRYASAFERDKIDEALLPDITDSTMRSLGLREGDIIRIHKAITQRQPTKRDADHAKQEQIRRDEELARQLQAEETTGKRGQAPNLFAGPNGALKNSVRRGRPQPSKSLPPPAVDLDAITTAGNQLQRSTTPLVTSPSSLSPGTPPVPAVQAPARSSSAAPGASGFDDDAWTNRPSSTKPLAPTPPAVAPRAPSAPPAPPRAPTPPATAPTPSAAQGVSSPPVTASASPDAGKSLAKTTEADVFDQLARLSQLRVQVPPPPPPAVIPAVATPPPHGYSQGMGMGSSPAPMGQHLQVQQTGLLSLPQNGPRGPYAPIPANQGLLHPLVPTNTGFNAFVPTRPQSTPSTFQQPYQPPSFLSAQPTSFSPNPPQPLLVQATGFGTPTPLLPQATGMVNGTFGGFGGMGSVPPVPPLPMNLGFNVIAPQTGPTGFTPGFGQSPFANPLPSSPAPQPPQNNTNPANVFAAMKSGTFANDTTQSPQPADKYDALRAGPVPLTSQPTGWGYPGMAGGFNFQH